MKIFLLMIFSFILGSVPFGIIIAKAKRIDLRRVGSGNIGATNVLRSAGKWPAVLTLLGDVFKGSLAVAAGKYVGLGPVFTGLMGISAVLGHNFSLFLGFKGGKGVATSIGVLLIYAPKMAVITILIWIVMVFLTKYSSLGAIVSFILLPFNFILFDSPGRAELLTAILLTALILWRHIDNIRRLLQGTERKIGQRA